MIVGNAPYSHAVLTWANSFFAAHGSFALYYILSITWVLGVPIGIYWWGERHLYVKLLLWRQY